MAQGTRDRAWATTAVVLVVFFLGWELISRSGAVPIGLFPPPTHVSQALVEMAKKGQLTDDLRASLWRAVAGFGMGSFIGIVVGLFTGRSQLADRCLSPIINLFRPLPPVAMIPLIIVWFGIGETSKAFSIAFAVFFPVWVNTHAGARAIPTPLLWSARTFHVPRRTIWLKVILPGSLPYIIVGLRIGLALTYVMVYVSELAGAGAGVGYRISIAHLAYRIDVMVAALCVLAALGAISDWMLTAASAVLFPWLPARSG